MPAWLIEPRDPLIARDGRPFGPNPGARASSLPFPYPSTLAGAVRTRAGSDENGAFVATDLPALRAIAVRGPLLVEYDEAGNPHCLAPAPADALLLQPAGPAKAGQADRRRLAPLRVDPNVQCGWPSGVSLALVGQSKPSPAKPLGGAPRFWYWPQFEGWLRGPEDGEIALDGLGHGGATPETRMHVRVAADTQTAAEGMLFQTSGLEFTRAVPGSPLHARLQASRRLALACTAATSLLRAGVGSLGGERRLVHWRQAEETLLPRCPGDVRDAVVQDGHCRLLLLTPACFQAGFLPEWLKSAVPGLRVEVIGAVLGRYQGVSGWDLETRKPKTMRKLVPAGAVYFLKLEGEPAARGQFVEKVWMECVSDDPQARLDGFGLAVLGVWDGQLRPMEVK